MWIQFCWWWWLEVTMTLYLNSIRIALPLQETTVMKGNHFDKNFESRFPPESFLSQSTQPWCRLVIPPWGPLPRTSRSIKENHSRIWKKESCKEFPNWRKGSVDISNYCDIMCTPGVFDQVNWCGNMYMRTRWVFWKSTKDTFLASVLKH